MAKRGEKGGSVEKAWLPLILYCILSSRVITSRERNIFQNNVFVLSSWLLVESKATFAFEEIYYRKGKLEATVSYKLYSDLFEVI